MKAVVIGTLGMAMLCAACGPGVTGDPQPAQSTSYSVPTPAPLNPTVPIPSPSSPAPKSVKPVPSTTYDGQIRPDVMQSACERLTKEAHGTKVYVYDKNLNDCVDSSLESPDPGDDSNDDSGGSNSGGEVHLPHHDGHRHLHCTITGHCRIDLF